MSKRAGAVDAVIVTCEHGGNTVPARYAGLFDAHRDLLDSHRGWDPGALELARRFSRALDAPLHYATTTRLLVELNRSEHHPSLFSIVTKQCPKTTKQEILNRYYRPYRDAVEAAIARRTRRRLTVLHLSVHTFTPVLDGTTRRADVGVLYDSGRAAERRFCDQWREELLGRLNADRGGSGAARERSGPHSDRPWTVRRNYPYKGSADGFTTYLRTRFPPSRYLGLELEVNQRFPLQDSNEWFRLQRTLVRSLAAVLARGGN